MLVNSRKAFEDAMNNVKILDEGSRLSATTAIEATRLMLKQTMIPTWKRIHRRDGFT